MNAKTSRKPGQSMYLERLKVALADGPKTVAELCQILNAMPGSFAHVLESGPFRRVNPSVRVGPWMLAEPE